MYKKKKNIDPQLKLVEHSHSALAISNKVKLSLYKKSLNSGIPTNILEEVYRRGYSIWNNKFKGTREQFAFDRVNSFVSGGFAANLDKDLMEADVPTPSVKDLANQHKSSIGKIKKLVKQGSKVEKEHTTSQKDAEEIARDHLKEKLPYYKLLKKCVESVDKNKPASRLDGTDSLVDIYKTDTPGQKVLKVIKKVCHDR